MKIGFLLDEDLPKWWRRDLTNRTPRLRVWRVGDPNAPPLHSPDPVLLVWCEQHAFYLLTDNRRTMPKHLAAHLQHGRHVPGIFMTSHKTAIELLAAILELIDGASFLDEHQDQIRYLPLTPTYP